MPSGELKSSSAPVANATVFPRCGLLHVPLREPENQPSIFARSITQRTTGHHGAQKYLQTPITADVVERAPNNMTIPRFAGVDAPVRLARLWTTSFGLPWCPTSKAPIPSHSDRSSHTLGGEFSVAMDKRSEPGGSRAFNDPVGNNSIRFRGLNNDGRYSAGKSGGHKTIRRATPSSSMSAAAAISWSVVAIRTEPPISSWHRPPSTDPESRSRRAKAHLRAGEERIASVELVADRLPKRSGAILQHVHKG